MLKIAICDDNNSVCSKIESIILEYKKYQSLEISIDVFWTGESLIEFIKKEYSFDLIFLDIELGTTTGIEVGNIIRSEFNDYISKIVFISGVDGYEMSLFEVQPLNFLRKPIRAENIYKSIELVLKILNLIDRDVFIYSLNNDFYKVLYKDVIYFESQKKKIKVVNSNINNNANEFYGSLEKLKESLPEVFIKTHRAYIVNFFHVKSLKSSSLVMSNGDTVPVSRNNIKALREKLLEFEKFKRDARL
ncbi:MAG: LytTR family DNA-binding domain-containing protein [bacterium]